ncbi:MAG TPA: ferredoxin, partial [Holophagaceae bacterium]|nr:ferredoxin [Holophagaceae bacterium]
MSDICSGRGETMEDSRFKIIKRVFIAEGCIPCFACEAECPEVFDVRDDDTYIRPDAAEYFLSQKANIEEAADGCPVAVIK